MMLRQILIAAALAASCIPAGAAESDIDAVLSQIVSEPVAAQPAALDAAVPMPPVLRAIVEVSSDVVRIGDLIDNSGPLAQVAVYRAPDLGMTGSLSTSEVMATLRSHQVIGVETRGITEVTVTRLARTLSAKDIEQKIAHALERRYGLGIAANLAVTFDRELGTLQLDPVNTGDMRLVATRFDARSNRFDVMFEIANDTGTATRLRFTGTAVETVEVGVVTRQVEVNEVLKASDVVTERRPRAEVGSEPATRDVAVGKQMRRALRAGQPLRVADLGNPDLVQRDQSVTLVYDNDGLYLTVRAKALESGAIGDQVSVLNPQSKRTVQGTVTGPSQVSVLVAPAPQSITTAAVVENPSRPQQ